MSTVDVQDFGGTWGVGLRVWAAPRFTGGPPVPGDHDHWLEGGVVLVLEGGMTL